MKAFKEKIDYVNVSDYDHHKKWIWEFNHSVNNMFSWDSTFNRDEPVNVKMIDKRVLNLEWLDTLKVLWEKGEKLAVLKELQKALVVGNLSKPATDKDVKYMSNIKPVIL